MILSVFCALFNYRFHFGFDTRFTENISYCSNLIWAVVTFTWLYKILYILHQNLVLILYTHKQRSYGYNLHRSMKSDRSNYTEHWKSEYIISFMISLVILYIFYIFSCYQFVVSNFKWRRYFIISQKADWGIVKMNTIGLFGRFIPFLYKGQLYQQHC